MPYSACADRHGRWGISSPPHGSVGPRTQCLSLPLRRRHQPVRKEGTVSTGAAVAGELVAFGVATPIGSALHSDDDWCPRWRAGTVYVSASR